MGPTELRRTLVLANAFKEGDLLVDGTRDDYVRQQARRMLVGTTLGDIRRTTLVDDGVSEALARSLDRQRCRELDPLTIGELKSLLIDPAAPDWVRRHRDGLTSEAIAAVARVMTNDELSSVARAIFNPLPGEGIAIGSSRHFGSRIQPNSPGDDEQEILFSILEGLTYGCGDVIIGLNPAGDDVDTIVRLEELLQSVVRRLALPTRYCVLSDIVKQHRAREHTQVDVGFQSLAGTSRALAGMVGLDADGVLDLARGFDGLYFETGQGSAVTNGAAEGIDMVTLESRAYGVARYIQRQTRAWTIVNDVAGFIGPEVFRTVEQLERACLEDSVMAKLHGLTMGLDVCATFHMGIPPAALHEATERIVARAAPAYLMAVAGNADPMLGYLTTSFREHPRLRRQTGRQIATSMEARLAALPASTADLYALHAKAGGDRRTSSSLSAEGKRMLNTLRDRGYDLARGAGNGDAGPDAADARLDAIYAHSRRALYARLDDVILNEVCPRSVRARTLAVDREDYLAHPPRGERLRDEDARVVEALAGAAQLQVVVSDGLNADAINEHLRAVLPPLRYHLGRTGCHVAATDIVIENGRVRAGYHVGALVDASIVVHMVGERPGTGINTASAYLTWGRDAAGRSRWRPDLDHSCTTAVCGIHPRGKSPEAAVDEIVRLIARMIERRCSGIALTNS
jgi:ethanolamine ammonia-lyase large subunit